MRVVQMNGSTLTASGAANKLKTMQPYPNHVTRHEATVLPEWIDHNGHMNLAYYVVVFDLAGDVLFDHIDIGLPFRKRTGYSSS